MHHFFQFCNSNNNPLDLEVNVNTGGIECSSMGKKKETKLVFSFVHFLFSSTFWHFIFASITGNQIWQSFRPPCMFYISLTLYFPMGDLFSFSLYINTTNFLCIIKRNRRHVFENYSCRELQENERMFVEFHKDPKTCSQTHEQKATLIKQFAGVREALSDLSLILLLHIKFIISYR